MNQMISVKDASSYLGVSPSTFKRLCERYAIPLHRTTGGHRRIDRADLDQAYKFFWNGARKKCVSMDTSDVDCARQIVKLLLNRNIDTILEIIWEQLESPCQLSRVLENTLIPALWHIGELWRTQEMDVYQEHICSSTVCTILDLLLCRMPAVEPTANLAIGGTFKSNLDSIASKVACLVLRSIGMRTVDLGCNLPAASIAKAASDLQPSIVWICHTHVESPESIVENHRNLRQSLAGSVRVFIGGGGLAPALRRSLCDCTYFESMTMMVEALMAEPVCTS